jgi:hypothetical protein
MTILDFSVPYNEEFLLNYILFVAALGGALYMQFLLYTL